MDGVLQWKFTFGIPKQIICGTDFALICFAINIQTKGGSLTTLSQNSILGLFIFGEK